MKIKNTYDGGYINVKLYVKTYAQYNNLCILLRTADTNEAYAAITINLQFLPYNQAVIDTNNMPEAIEFIERYNLGVDTGKRVQSGFCEYPIYQFSMDKLSEFAESDD